MSRRVIYNMPVLLVLTKNHTDQQLKHIIKELSINQLVAIVEISINLLYGNIQLSPSQKESLQSYSKVINYLAKDTPTLKNKRKYISRNIQGVKQIILAANKHIISIKKQNDRSRETSPSTMGEIYTPNKE
jgi:hypothetical protein